MTGTKCTKRATQLIADFRKDDKIHKSPTGITNNEDCTLSDLDPTLRELIDIVYQQDELVKAKEQSVEEVAREEIKKTEVRDNATKRLKDKIEAISSSSEL